MSEENTPSTAAEPAERRSTQKTGTVTSTRMQKTITVAVERMEKHRLYGKYIRKRTVLKVHDENEEAQVGDRVQVEFTRPLSKTKRWRLVRVLRGEGG